MYRVFSVVLALALVGCGSSPIEPVKVAQAGVTTESGFVVPYLTKDVLTWSDIPYAQPPVGDLRWKAPRRLAGDPGVTLSAKPGVACVQMASDSVGVPGEGIVGQEDCLYLDIKAPLADSEQARPVMFWIHGGGNTSGYKGFYNYDELVRREDVVVVSFNYRLGPLGWFTHPAIQGGQSDLDQSSNFGHLDIIAALQWVQSNIATFGGDPNNVTIFGESAGGHNVFAMLASPLAEGLFHKAISQSGYVKSATPEQAFQGQLTNPHIRRSATQILEQLQVDASATASELRAVSATDLYQAFYELEGDGDVPLTTADGIVIPAEGFMAALGNPRYAKNIPVIAGANRDEVTLWLGTHRYFVEASYPFTRLLPPKMRLKNPEVYSDWIDVRSTAWKIRGVDQPLDQLTQAGYSQLYAYRFDWDDQETSFFADFPNVIGAAHGVDIAFLTGDFKYGPISRYIYPDSPERDELMQTMMAAWSGFARSGMPKAPIEWPQYTPDERAFIHLDVGDQLRVAYDSVTVDLLLQRVSGFDHLTYEEQCLLGWDTLTKVGQPHYEDYARWSHCTGVSATEIERSITESLLEEYGTTSVL